MTDRDVILAGVWFGLAIYALAKHRDPALVMGWILAILIIARTSH